MSMKHFSLETDNDGIVVATWDSPEKTMNVFTEEVMEELNQIVDMAVADAAIKGVVIASGKDQFSGGADLSMIEGLLLEYHRTGGDTSEAAMQRLFDESRRMTLLYRKLETCGKPFVAAINGVCLGGATELALSCHGRVMADDEKLKFGLPEVKVGIFPGAGGTQRVMRMVPDFQAGLEMLLQGKELKPKKALAMNLVDKVVPKADLIAEAKAMIAAGLDAKKPWDKDGFRVPGGLIYSAKGMQLFPAANAIYRKTTFNNYPGGRYLLQAVYEGLQVPMDAGLTIESRYFAKVLRSKEAAAMIRSLFVSMQALNKGARRPKDEPETHVETIAVIGAGFMGAGVAYVSALSGLNVVLIDQSMEAAEKGKARIAELAKGSVMKGRMKEDAAQALIDRVTPAGDYSALKPCDLIIEAVFEDRKVKAAVYEAAKPHIKQGAIFASNTSTLPITTLAESYGDAENFIGIHFFSPVEKMMLVELIKGKETGNRAIATALDYVKRIRKTPILVNDTRGFFANRCVLNYVQEGHLMLLEGVPPALIENLGKAAGMPVGPLSLNDEVALDLSWKIIQATKNDLGADAINADIERILHEMVIKGERLGRKNGKGFYDYQGRDKALWSGLSELAPPKPAAEFDYEELKNRFLFVQALEAARVFEEGVVTDVREADVGAILGFGFAPYTGGPLSMIDFYGVKAFIAEADKLHKKHGERFKVPQILHDLAAKNDTFYGLYPPEGAAGKAA